MRKNSRPLTGMQKLENGGGGEMRAGVTFGKKKYWPDVGPMYRKEEPCPWDIEPRRRDCEKERGV